MTNRITLRAKSDGTEIRGELDHQESGLWFVRLAPEVDCNAFSKDCWDSVYALPTTPGTVFRATVRGAENVRVFVDADGNFRSASLASGRVHHDPIHIDTSTVVIQLEGESE